jgi:hypothetical protein
LDGDHLIPRRNMNQIDFSARLMRYTHMLRAAVIPAGIRHRQPESHEWRLYRHSKPGSRIDRIIARRRETNITNNKRRIKHD